MCRVLAKASVQPETPNLELLKAPHCLLHQSERARMPKGYGPHDDGSGVAWLQDGRVRLEKRGAVDAWDPSFQDLVESIRTTALIAHNRKASVGLDVNVNVSHPYTMKFRGDEVAFCHNGGIKTFMTEARDRKITDSMVFLERLISKVGTLSLEDLKTFLVEASATWEYSSINALLLTKDSLFAW